MDASVEKMAGATVVAVSGRLDTVTAPGLEKTFNGIIAEGENMIVADLAALDYISSVGLRVILASAKKLKGAGGEILLCGLAGTVKEVFEISGFNAIFRIFDSPDCALKAL